MNDILWFSVDKPALFHKAIYPQLTEINSSLFTYLLPVQIERINLIGR